MPRGRPLPGKLLPLTPHALAALAKLTTGPCRSTQLQASVVSRLKREGLVHVTFPGRMTFVTITQAGRDKLKELT